MMCFAFEGGGWKDFVMDNKIQVGNYCRVLLRPRNVTFHSARCQEGHIGPGPNGQNHSVLHLKIMVESKRTSHGHHTKIAGLHPNVLVLWPL